MTVIQGEVASAVDIDFLGSSVRGKQAVATITESTGWTFDLSNTSSGLQELAVLVTKIKTSPVDNALCIEEPELHLHAGAQRALRGIIEDFSGDHQFFITTHSTIFANAGPDSSVYLVTKKDGQSHVVRLSGAEELKSVKWELGHSNVDYYAFDLIVFIEGDTEKEVLPAVAEALGYDLTRAGIYLQNVRGSGKAKKIGQFLEYLRDSDIVPFVIADGDKEVKQKIEDWERAQLIPRGNFRIWDLEFEDLFPPDLIAECCSELGYKGVTTTELQKRGRSSVVHVLDKILSETGQQRLDKPALAETIARRISESKKIPTELDELIKRLWTLAGPSS
jgi:predicted ATP-dependent endonuclease of OLD family